MNDESAWQDCPLAVVDVETTGLDATVDRIIEVAVIHMQGGEVTDRWQSLINPEQAVPDEVVQITGIDRDKLVDAPVFAKVAEIVRDRMQGRILVAYNLPFDRGFLAAELARCDIELETPRKIDPLVFVRQLHKDQGSKRLGAVAERLNITLTNAHRAADDAEVAGRVLYALADELPHTLGDLRLLQDQWEIQQQNEMAAWRNREGGGIDAATAAGFGAERGNALGPAYVYGWDTDPVRAMFVHLPDSGARRN